MTYRSLGEFIVSARKNGDVKDIQGADLEVEVGCLTEMSAELDGPLLLFSDFKGYSKDFRVASNVYRHSIRRFAFALGLPTDLHPIDLLQRLRALRRTQKPVAPVEVGDGPVLENSVEGADVDVGIFPAPRWHSHDGGHYIGTGDIVIVRDPETGWINYGTYRACVQGRDKVSLWIIKNKRARIIAEKYWARGLACPIAVVLGCDPLTFMASTSRLKYEYAGALRGAPVEVVPGPLTQLPIPAEAEIVLEGEMPSPEEETVHEGPFGEWPGYYSHAGQECVVRVKRVSYRNQPIIFGQPPLRPLLSWNSDLPDTAVRAWDHLESAGITDITGVWGHCHGLMLVIALRQRYAGHAKQALITANGIAAAGSMFGYCVAVDDDIDPSNMREVLWALCTRVNPAVAMDIVRNAWTSDLDPRLTPEQKQSHDYTMDRVLIDACRPYHWKSQYPSANVFSASERQQVQTRWRGLLEEIERESQTRRESKSTS